MGELRSLVAFGVIGQLELGQNLRRGSRNCDGSLR